MNAARQWNVALILPGENEVSLLAELSRRRDARVVGVLDPAGQAIGTTIAEVMGIPVFTDPAAEGLRAADCWVYPPGDPEALRLVETLARLGQAPLPTVEFQRLLTPPPVTTVVAPPSPRPFERLERETESIHRTLSRIEEALQRESLLRWLLSLATRAVGATAGSIMLFDEKSGQLYVACAYGLSEATLHATRVPLGHGIAGRVAERLRSELVLSRPAVEPPRDRPDIAAAVSAPLVHEGRLLGVLNVSVAVGDRLLGEDDLATIDRLARRLGLILHRFLGIQRAQEGELFRDTDRALQELMHTQQDLGAILAGWAAALCMRAGAAQAALAVVCADGTLLVAEAMPGGDPRVAHRAPDNAAWSEVLQTGRPLVVREVAPGERPAGGERTLFYLPVGKLPVQAVLTAVFISATEAHRFHDVSGEMVWLLEKRLPELLSRFVQHDRLERFAALTAALTGIAAAEPGAPAGCGSSLDILAAAAAHLTGAESAHVVLAVEEGRAIVAPGASPAPEPWLEIAGRLMEEAVADGWRTTLLAAGGEPSLEDTCLLAVTAGTGAATPGLLLLRKRRLYPLDGAVFTEFDAELAGRLARLVPALLRARAPVAPQPAVLEVVGEEPVPPAEAAQHAAREREELFVDALRREMDRCDRYHGAFSLLALRPLAAGGWDPAAAAALATRLAGKVRTSDLVSALPDGTVVVLAPEETQSVSRLERRVVALLREVAGDPALPLAAGRVVYPGRHDDPRAVLAAAVAALEALP